MSLIDKIWYEKVNCKNIAAIVPLMPFNLLFKAISHTRRELYKNGISKSVKLNIPVIVVGGIAVGGTGKTPLCIALVNYLAHVGYKVGLISRGYKGTAKSYPLTVLETTDPKECGDEPYLIKACVGDNAVVAVDPVRERGAKYLEDLGCEVIVTDDGLQHYSLQRDIEIIVIDGKRGLGNGLLMPAGPLREGKWHLDKADCVVVNGVSSDTRYKSMTLSPQKVVSIASFCKKDSTIDYLQAPCKVAALAGIGNPKRFYDTLKDSGFEIVKTIDVGDHKRVDVEVLKSVSKTTPIVMTSKDAVKYANLAMDNLYVLNVEAILPQSFYHLILDKLNKLIHDKQGIKTDDDTEQESTQL